MRYDVFLQSVLCLPIDDDGARAAAWRQLVDVLAQDRGDVSEAVYRQALARLEELRDAVSADVRRQVATDLDGLASMKLLNLLFKENQATVAAAVMPSPDLLSAMPDAVTAPAPNAGEDVSLNIRQMVARIEALRVEREDAPLPHEPNQASAARFVFETDVDGLIDWVSGAAREPLIGHSIGIAAEDGAHGSDGVAAGAFRRRAPFRDARLSVAGRSANGGDWLVSASPIFNPRDGRFTGYHGSARRPRPDEMAIRSGARLAGTSLPADSMRQLVHELRTPLNAIQGFGEMIERQILGPAASAYRERATKIVRESHRLVTMVDDLDSAAKLDAGQSLGIDASLSSLLEVLDRVAAGYRESLDERGIMLRIAHDAETDGVAVGSTILDRLVGRLVGASVGLAARGETIEVGTQQVGEYTKLMVTRPAILDGRDETVLLDPGYGPEGEWPDAPILGLGFTLRLIGKLAVEAQAEFNVLPDTFELWLPQSLPISAEDRSGDRL